MTRRTFFAGLAGAGYLSGSRVSVTTLEAISGPRLPHTLVIPTLNAETSGYFELREYASASPLRLDQFHRQFIQDGVCSRCGIRLLSWERGDNLRYLFKFDSLDARAHAWTAFASDPAWIQFREAGDSVRPAAVSIYVGQRHSLPQTIS